jgi:hypothetical protein
MELVFVVTDTNIFQYVAKSGFQQKFLEICTALSLRIVTLFQVEQEIKHYPACQKLFNLLKQHNIIHQYTTPQEFKAQENDMYITLKAMMDDADAASIPVAILNDWILLTNDEEAIGVFKESFQSLSSKLKPMSFESLLYLAFQKGLIDESEGDSILAAYKASCFESEHHQNHRIRGRNFLEMITFMHKEGISPLRHLP